MNPVQAAAAPRRGQLPAIAGPVNVGSQQSDERANRRKGVRKAPDTKELKRKKDAPTERETNCSLCTAAAVMRHLTLDPTWTSQRVAWAAGSTSQDREVFSRYWDRYCHAAGMPESPAGSAVPIRNQGNPLAGPEFHDGFDPSRQVEGLLTFIVGQSQQRAAARVHNANLDAVRGELGKLPEGNYVLGVLMRNHGHWVAGRFKKSANDESELEFLDFQTNVDNDHPPASNSLPIEPRNREGVTDAIMDVLVMRWNPDGAGASDPDPAVKSFSPLPDAGHDALPPPPPPPSGIS